MKEKINVLVLPSDRTGVGKFRSVDPHLFLQKLYSDDFHVDIVFEPDFSDISFWKKYPIVHFHRSIGQDIDKSVEFVKFLNDLGTITICDLDDYWLPTKEHPLHHLIIQNKFHEKILENLKVAKYVTTTTEIFADEIKKYNKNVVVLPNAIDPNESQFKQITPESDKIRVGWLGGSSHLHDLMLLDGMVDKLSPIKEKLQFVLCGYDTRGTMTEIDKNTGQQKQRPIKPNETVWYEYEKIFTSNYKIVTDEYRNHLLKFADTPFPNEIDESYLRVWTKPVTSYAKNYSKFDISLAPIKHHIFNKVKSQLKVIEAGFYKKALIASNFGPYTIDLTHCLKNGEFVDGNALLVDEQRNHSDWAKYIKKLTDNPNMIKDMGERLYEHVSQRYDLNIVTKTRAEFYKSIV
jgi:glycosyltransferase involved in cell wall biosynthesis